MHSMNLYPYVWLGIAIVLALFEAFTIQLVAIWFSLGALVAILPAALGAPVPVQILVFVLVSALSMILTRPFLQRVLKVKRQPTNADAVIGQVGVVLEEIDNLEGAGKVRANGLDWTARTERQMKIPAGAEVKVLRIEGVKLIVEPLPVPGQAPAGPAAQ